MPLHTNSAVSRQIYVHALLLQHLYSVSVYYLFRFVSLKNVHLTVQVCCLFYFLLHNTFFKEKVRSEILVGFIVFFKSGFFQKPGGVFWLGSITSTLKNDNYERLVEFLSQISKLL